VSEARAPVDTPGQGAAATEVATAAGGTTAAERRLLRYAPGVRGSLFAAVACGFAAAAAVVAGAWLVGLVVARVFLAGQSLPDVAGLLVGVAALATIRAPFLWAADMLAQRASTRVKSALREDLTTHLFALGPSYVGRERSGELTSALVDGMEAVDAYVTSFQPARQLAVAVPLLVLFVILVLDPPTTLVLLFTGPILVLLLAMIGSRTRAVTDRRFVELRWLSAFFLDMLQGIATLKMFGRSAEQVDNIRAISRQYGDTTMEVLRTAFQTSLALEWGGAVAVALVAVEISLRLMTGSITFDVALAVLIIVPEFFTPLRQLAARYHSGSAGRTAAARAFAILDEAIPRGAGNPGDGARPASRPAVTSVPADPAILIRDLSFSYPGRSERALDRVDMSILAGRCVALVGETGSGKSTLTGVLLGFLEPDRGEILVGGVPLREVDPAAWRRHVTWVPQQPHLFHGTVGDNILLARPGASRDDLLAAAREAGVAAFVDTLAHGYDTRVGEGGARLSGGQRQRIAIARAFLADAPFVILDEATSHLDAANETAIREAIVRLARRRTVLIVSHRLRLVSIADSLVVLDHGRVVESGAPADLALQDGPYHRLLQARRTDPDGES